MINIKEIQEIENKRKKIKKEIYTKIYEQFCKKIRMSVDMGVRHAEVSVPSFVIGYPTFDQYQASTYLKRQLTNAGFTVKYTTSPLHFLVSWNVSRPTGSSKSEPPPEEPGALPSLINLKKLASKHKNTA